MRRYVNPLRAGEPYEVYHDDADGVRSQMGWYYEDEHGLICGPFYNERTAEDKAHRARSGDDEQQGLQL